MRLRGTPLRMAIRKLSRRCPARCSSISTCRTAGGVSERFCVMGPRSYYDACTGEYSGRIPTAPGIRKPPETQAGDDCAARTIVAIVQQHAWVGLIFGSFTGAHISLVVVIYKGSRVGVKPDTGRRASAEPPGRFGHTGRPKRVSRLSPHPVGTPGHKTLRFRESERRPGKGLNKQAAAGSIPRCPRCILPGD